MLESLWIEGFWNLKSDFTLILGYPNSALNNLVLEYKRLSVNFQEIWTKS